MISIIMATHNRAKIISQAIKSVIWQTMPDWELIVVDDGSTDNTRSVVNSFADKRIKYINEGKQPYYTYVRNLGIKNSSGDLLCYRDDDGVWDKQYLELMSEPHKAKDVAVTYCRRFMHKDVDLSTMDLDKLDFIPGALSEKVYYSGKESLSNIIDVGDIMHKRSVFNKDFTGFTEEMDNPGYCSDAKLMDTIDKNNHEGKFVLVDYPLHHYFLNHGSTQMTLRKLKAREEGKMADEVEWKF